MTKCHRGLGLKLGKNSMTYFMDGPIPAQPANSALTSTLTISSPHCPWGDEMVRTAEDKKIKLLTLHTHGCPRASLRVCTSILLES